jgi:glycosyltransferase involved in cell wall biosynthesis
MVLEHDFPPDIRVEKEARSLLAAGHELTIVCGNGQSRPDEDRWEGARVVRVSSGRLRAKWEMLRLLTLFQDTRFRSALRANADGVSAFHVHDLPLARTTLSVARPAGVPVVLDLHENFPDFVAASRIDRPVLLRIAGALLSPVWRWSRYQARAARAAARVVAVVDETADYLREEGIPADRITVIENTEEAERFLAIPTGPLEELAGVVSSMVLLYVGDLGGRYRGLETVLGAMPAILRAEPDAVLVLVGDGPVRARLEAQTRLLGIDGSVRILGRKPFDRVPSFIAASDVCLVPHLADPHTDAALPHKLFQYMLMGKPVVASSCRSLRRVVEETGAGLIFRAGDAGSLADAVLSLRDPERRRILGAAGMEAATTSYEWGRSAERLLQLYESLA